MEEALKALAKAVELALPWLHQHPETRVLHQRLRHLPSYAEPQAFLAVVRELVAEAAAEAVARGWDRYGAPTVARTEEGDFVGSFEGPGGAYTVRAQTKREAYRQARREWVRRLVGRGP